MRCTHQRRSNSSASVTRNAAAHTSAATHRPGARRAHAGCVSIRCARCAPCRRLHMQRRKSITASRTAAIRRYSGTNRTGRAAASRPTRRRRLVRMAASATRVLPGWRSDMATRLNGRGDVGACGVDAPLTSPRSPRNGRIPRRRGPSSEVSGGGWGVSISGARTPETVAMLIFLRAQVSRVGGVS